MTETEAARRRAITRIGQYLPWRKDWLPRDADEYHRALEDLTPDAVDAAVSEAIRTRRTIPSANQLRDIHDDLEKRRRQTRRDTRERTDGSGVGCPTCRADLGDHATGREPLWIGDGAIITCTMHPWSWPGTTHQPGQQDPGDIDPHEWRRRALNGAYGDVLRRIAERGGTPADVIPAVAGDITTDVQEALR